MPHAIEAEDTAASTSTSRRALMASMNPNSTTLNKQRSPLTFGQTTSQTSTATKRASLPSTDNYAAFRGESDVGDFQQKHLGNRNSMLADYDNVSRQRAQFYEEQFQYKESENSNVRERVSRNSPVIAELRTNVIIKDEFTLVTDISYHLAARYTRPDSAIMVKVDHSACLAMGGTFDPCYLLTITAVPAQMGPTMNKRNATLIQSFMADILSVPPERGIVTFTSIPDESLATNGTTMLGEIERQEKQQSTESSSAMQRVISSGKKSIPSFKKAMSKSGADVKGVGSKVADSQQREQPKSTVTDVIINDLRERRRSVAGPLSLPLAMLSSDDIFELSAGEAEKKRPSTAHSHTALSGYNGLRMNGISDAHIVDPILHKPKSPNGRPQTFSGASTAIMDPAEFEVISDAAPPPPPVRLATESVSRRERPPSFLKTDPSKQTPKPASRPSTANDRSSPPLLMGNKPNFRNSHLDGLMGTPSTFKGAAQTLSRNSSTNTEPAEQSPPGNGGETRNEKDETTANTAKRRSTISTTTTTALPKMEPPPIPKTIAKSNKSLKVGKRKSFLSAFRRSPVPPPTNST